MRELGRILVDLDLAMFGHLWMLVLMPNTRGRVPNTTSWKPPWRPGHGIRNEAVGWRRDKMHQELQRENLEHLPWRTSKETSEIKRFYCNRFYVWASPSNPPPPPLNGHGTPLPLRWGYVVRRGEQQYLCICMLYTYLLHVWKYL